MPSENKVTIKLDLSPPHLSVWDEVNFQDMISLAPTNSISDFVVTRNPDGTVDIEFTYNQDMEGEELTVFVDPSASGHPALSRSKSSVSSFTIISDNNQAAYLYGKDVYELAETISVLSEVVCILAWLMMLIGLFAGKLVGVEMMAVIQFSFLSLISLKTVNPCVNALSSLRWINGFNSLELSNILDDTITPPQPKGLYLYSQFAENYNITSLLILLPLLSGIVILILSKTLCKEKPILEKVWKRLVGEYTFCGLMLSAYIISCSTALEFLFGIQDTNSQLTAASIAECCIFLIFFVVYFILLLKVPEIFGEFTEKFKKNDK